MEKIKELVKNIVEGYKKHSVIYTIILVPVILVVGYAVFIVGVFTAINYSLRHQYDDEHERIAKIIPFSQRGLPVPETDVPVTLPLDPGEAGKATLAGIDSNNDGVRDDLEREIVYMYPQNEEVRRVLRAMVKKEQEILTVTDGDKEYFLGLRTSAFDLNYCYYYLVFGDNVPDFTNSNILLAMLKNTKGRKNGHRENEEKALPFAHPVGGSKEKCEALKLQGKY